MKRIFFLTIALALVFGMSQCKKTRPNMPQYCGAVGDMYVQHVTVGASHGSGNSKIDGDEIGTKLKLWWQTGDKLNVYNKTYPETAIEPLTLIGEGGSSVGYFAGRVTGTSGDNLTFYYKGSSAVVTCNGGAVTYAASNFMNQDGTLHGDNGILKRMFVMKKDVVFPLDGSTLELKAPYAIFKFDLKAFGTAGGNTVTISKDGTDVVSVTGVTNVDNNPYYVAVPADDNNIEYTFSGNGLTAKAVWKIDGNVFCTNENAAVVIVPPFAAVVTIPVCAIHATCASSGGVVTGTGVDEQGVCWSTNKYPKIADNTYVHQYKYEYSTGTFSLTPKNETTNNTFTGFMSGLTPGATYHVRAYIKKGDQVVYGDDIEFTTLTEEPTIQYVDLGLSVKWATCNMGAAYEYDCGDYYMWGDNAACSTISPGTTYYVSCGLQSERYAANSWKKYTKYCPSDKTGYWYSGAGTPDNKLVLYDADDCVQQTLGVGWRMPTETEWEELFGNTTREWTTSGGVSGWRFTGNGNSIFLPAAGFRSGKNLNYAGTYGCYWSSSLYLNNPDCAYYLHSYSSGVLQQTHANRCFGMPVRPVK